MTDPISLPPQCLSLYQNLSHQLNFYYSNTLTYIYIICTYRSYVNDDICKSNMDYWELGSTNNSKFSGF